MKILVMVLMMVALASASTIGFLGTSGASNGVVYVGPYDLTENGAPIFGTCISYDLRVGPPWQWQATEKYIGDFSGAMQTKLLEAEWLNQKFDTNSDWIGIHEGIWGLFGASFLNPNALAWQILAQNNWLSVDPNSFYVLVPNTVNETQSFLVRKAETVPEPVMSWLIGGALVLLGAVRYRG